MLDRVTLRHGRGRIARVLNYENLFVCDNSVFPASPAANPSLTLAVLALRLADHLKSQ